jgi:hypothetical protein
MSNGKPVQVTAEPTPFVHEGWQIFKNAIIERCGSAEREYRALILVEVEEMQETQQMESREGWFPAHFIAELEDRAELSLPGVWDREYPTLLLTNPGDMEVMEWDEDCAYFAAWFDHLTAEHTRYAPFTSVE